MGGWSYLARAYIHVKKFEDATSAWVRWAELTGKDKETVKLFVTLVEEHALTGEPVSFPPELESLFKSSLENALYYAMLGQREKTLALLEQNYEEGYYWDLHFMKIIPEYDFIRSEPRFIALMRKMGFEEE